MARILTAIVLLLAGAALGAGGMYYLGMKDGGSDVATISFYGDWRLNCPAPSETDRVCELVQSVTDNRNGEAIFRIAIRRTDAGEEMAVIAPFGILLEPGVGIAFGETEPRKLDIEVCDEAGCRAVIPVDDKLFANLGAREMGTAVMTGITGEMVSLPISLKGLSDGLSALRSRGNRASLLDTIRQGLNEII